MLSCLPAGAGYFRLVAIAMAVASHMLSGDRAMTLIQINVPRRHLLELLWRRKNPLYRKASFEIGFEEFTRLSFRATIANDIGGGQL